MAGEATDGERIEEVDTVIEAPADDVAVFHEGEDEIELRDAAVQLNRADPVSRQLQPLIRGHVLERKHDVEERMASRIALRVQFGNQALERRRLVLEGAKRHVPDPAEQLPEARVSRQIRAKDKRIHEEADQPVDFRLRAPGNRRSDRDVFLPAVAMQE